MIKLYLLDTFGKYRFLCSVEKSEIASFCADNGYMVDSHKENRYYIFSI